MKLDESIELKNKKIEKLEEMNRFKYLPLKHVRAFMNDMMLNENINECMYDVLKNEGFLPENLNEDESYEETYNQLMDDDDIVMEMYESCMKNESECGGKMQEWVNEKLIGNQDKLDMNNNGDIDADDFEILGNKKDVEENQEVINKFQDQYGKDKGKEIYYATANKQGRNPETFEVNEISDEMSKNSKYFDKLVDAYRSNLVKLSVYLNRINPEYYIKSYLLSPDEFNLNDFIQYIKMSPSETTMEYYERLTEKGNPKFNMILNDFISPTRHRLITRFGGSIKDLVEIEDITGELFDIVNRLETIWSEFKHKQNKERFSTTRNTNLDNNDFSDSSLPISSVKRKMTAFSPDSVEYSDLFERVQKIYEEVKTQKPKKGVNVDNLNKSNADKENKEMISLADKSQKTITQKVDNLKNQKYELNDTEKDLKNRIHGFRNNLDLGYTNDLSKEQKDRIIDQASGKAPKDHANVDTESKVGEKLVDSAKTRVNNKSIGKDDYTSAHDVTSIEDNDVLQRVTAVDEQLLRMKNLYGYSDDFITTNKKKTSNEDERLFESVSKKGLKK